MSRKENARMSLASMLGRMVATAVTLALLAAAPEASAQALRRDLSSYLFLTMKRGSLKNMRIGSPCNVGVNCGSPSPVSKCGVLALGRVTAIDGGQVVAAQTYLRKPGAQLWQLFRNDSSSLANVTLLAPPPNPQTFAAPVIPGTCDAACNPNYAAMKQACGFPSPFPACDFSRPVKVVRGDDCAPFDTVPGNRQCDLPPGTYGNITINDGGRLNLDPGIYVACLFHGGQDTTTTADSTTILLPSGALSKNALRVNNGSELGADCGDLRILVDGRSRISFGRGGVVAAEVCAPESKISLGHNNILIGSFVSDSMSADLNNFGRCCGGTCSCFDQLVPSVASVNTVVTATGNCHVETVTDVRVCGFAAPVVSRSPGEVQFQVPALAVGSCQVEFFSPAGSFLGTQRLTVS
jgi:hypothetical protein